MRCQNRIFAALFVSLLLSPFAGAQEGAAQVKHTISIEAQPLAEALKDFSDQTGLQLAYVATLTENKTSNSVENATSPDDALSSILDNTGLEHHFVNDETVAIGVSDHGGASDQKNAGPAPILMAQNTTSQAPMTESNRNSEGDTSVVTGRVTDARTGANLKGAKVTIEETGQWTATNNLGEFRIVNVPTGSATLTVSFLGYARQSIDINVSGSSVARDFALRSGSEIEEIVVFGQRSARMQALNLERTANNSVAVLSSDQLGAFNGSTISEALRRAPGVAFVPDPETGEGAQIVVRGLSPGFNQVTLNGVRLPDGTGFGRAPDLSSILTESIDSVTINYSLLPSQDSNGAGALVEIETKSPLDRPRRFAGFTAEKGIVDGDFGDELEFGGTVAATFGSAGDLGASLSVAYRERERETISYSTGSGSRYAFGQYKPLDATGQPIRIDSEIDPRRRFPFEPGVDEVYPLDSVIASEGRVASEALSVTATLEKQFGSTTNWRLDLSHNARTTENQSSSVNVATRAAYDFSPVSELDDEVRGVFVTEDPFRNFSPNGQFFFGDGLLGDVGRSASYTPDNTSKYTTISFRGNTSLNRWTFGYELGGSRSESDRGRQTTLTLNASDAGDSGLFGTIVALPEFLEPEALNRTTGDGRIVSIFAPLTPNDDGFVVPLFNDAGFAFYNDLDTLGVRQISRSEPRDNGVGEAISTNLSARRDFRGSLLSYLKVGLDYREESFSAPGGEVFTGDDRRIFLLAPNVRLSDLGIGFGPGILTRVGAARNFDSLSRNSIRAVAGDLESLIQNGTIVQDIPDNASADNRVETEEDTLVGYVEGQFEFGDLEVIGGFRLERIDLSSTAFRSPQFNTTDPDKADRAEVINSTGEFVTESVDQFEVMPRVLANYRFNENTILRGGYYATVSRPQIQNLTQFTSVTLTEGSVLSTDQRDTLSVRRGNPDLAPATTHNFDLRFEWYGSDARVIKASVFYKAIDNPLQSNQLLGGQEVIPDDLTLPPFPEFNELLAPDVIVNVSQPENGEDTNRIWGFDVSLEQYLDFLPEVFDGLGVYANYTYTDSSSTREFQVDDSIDDDGVVEISGVPFDGSPEHQGTFGFTYTNHGFDGALLYSAQSRRLTSVEPFGMNLYDEAIDSLDLQLTYTRSIGSAELRLLVAGNDLLRGEDEAYLRQSMGGEGTPKYFTQASYIGGRQLIVGLSITGGF